MKKKNIEKSINKTISNNVPDVLDEILVKCEKKRGFNDMKKSNILENTKKNYFPKFASLVATAVICIFAVVGFGLYNNRVESIIELDVNPSIELRVDKKEEIISAVALNKDAEKILKDMDLKDVNLNVAVNAIIGSMMKNGYLTIDQNSILVSVRNDNTKESEQLQKELTEEINSLLKASAINGSVLTQNYNNKDKTVEKLAQEYGISEGKVVLINNVLKEKIINSRGEEYTFKQLAGLSINELNLLLNEKNININTVNTSGTASQSAYIGKEEAKKIALEDANINEVDTKGLYVEFDADDGFIIYEVDFRVGNKEYEYDINAKTGKIIHRESGFDDDYIDNTINDNNITNNGEYISKEKAKSIAITNSNLREADVYQVEIEFDKEHGVAIYEVDFKSGRKEYSYEIDAVTGKVLHKEVEIDD